VPEDEIELQPTLTGSIFIGDAAANRSLLIAPDPNPDGTVSHLAKTTAIPFPS